jgi:hypothetical protein
MPTHRLGALGSGTPGGLDDAANPFDENGHLVTDLTDIAGRGGQCGQVRAIANPHQQQIPVLHLDHRLQHLSALEQLRGTGRQAGKPGRHRSQLIGTFAR